jgi:antitoxin HicB
MRQFVYPANVKKDEAGFYLVSFPDISFAATDDKSLETALHEAKDCLEEAIAFCIKDNREIPEPSKPEKGQYLIILPSLMAAKAALYIAMKESHISNVKFAAQMGLDEKEIRRMIDPHHQTKIPRIEQALSYLGKKLILSMENAA